MVYLSHSEFVRVVSSYSLFLRSKVFSTETHENELQFKSMQEVQSLTGKLDLGQIGAITNLMLFAWPLKIGSILWIFYGRKKYCWYSRYDSYVEIGVLIDGTLIDLKL